MTTEEPSAIIDELDRLRRRDARWRRVVELLLDSTLGARTMRDALERIVDEPDERLTDEGIAARDAYREFQRLVKGQ